MVLICGVPNAGKTTYAERYPYVVHMDDYAYGEWEDALRDAPDTVCVDGILSNMRQRRRLLEICHDKRPHICIYIDIDLETSISREQRGRSAGVLGMYYQQFEPPTYAEGWDKIIHIT